MDVKVNFMQLRQSVQERFSSSQLGKDLLACIDAWEREPELLEQLRHLQEDNGKLTEQLKKLRAVQAKEAGYMSSRLREALRE